MSQLLQGLTFLNTRPLGQASVLTELLVAHDADIVEFPTLAICGPDYESRSMLLREVVGLERQDWIVFTSANGIEAAVEILCNDDSLNTCGTEKNKSSRLYAGALQRCKVAVIGEKTRECAKSHSLDVSFTASISNSNSFAREFLESLRQVQSLSSGCIKILLLRGQIASVQLPQQLDVPWIDLVSIPVYDVRMPPYSNEELDVVGRMLAIEESNVFALKRGKDLPYQRKKVDMIILTSSQSARNLMRMFRESDVHLKQDWEELIAKIPVAVIGQETATTVEELGLCLEIVAKETSMESLVQSIVEYYGDSVA